MAWKTPSQSLLRLSSTSRKSYSKQHGRPHPLSTPAAPLPSRRFQSSSAPAPTASFAFAFDIDGVLLRASDPIPGAHAALSFLQREHIPFVLLTNGGGKSERERVAELSARLQVPLDTRMFVQSHTPFAELQEYKEKTVLVVGGDGEACRRVAEGYGFKSVVTPGDIFVDDPTVWPFSSQFLEIHRASARALPKSDSLDPDKSLKIDAIFVYNDPRDWGLDATIILDLLLSKQGVMGTLSSKNGNVDLPNKGYQQDGQPALFFCNPDLWWAAKHSLPRLGQGGFREALEGLWRAVTGGGVDLVKTLIGKPYPFTFSFAETKLLAHRKSMYGTANTPPLKQVYMVGDNPDADILGGNSYQSPNLTLWSTILVQTGVYAGGTPSVKPTTISKNVYDAVNWAVSRESWPKNIDS